MYVLNNYKLQTYTPSSSFAIYKFIYRSSLVVLLHENTVPCLNSTESFGEGVRLSLLKSLTLIFGAFA